VTARTQLVHAVEVPSPIARLGLLTSLVYSVLRAPLGHPCHDPGAVALVAVTTPPPACADERWLAGLLEGEDLEQVRASEPRFGTVRCCGLPIGCNM